ncbi:hypothetical protein ADMFC3_18760 [Geovibrio sp. ADMFC3]
MNGTAAKITTFPAGTHVDHTPIGIPLSEGGNHADKADGATTENRHIPAPSTTRLIMRSRSEPAVQPRSDPASKQPRATVPSVFTPVFCKSAPEGRAHINPESAKADISHPEAARLMSSSLISLCIIGGTLN